MAKIKFSIRSEKKDRHSIASLYVTVRNGTTQKVTLKTKLKVPVQLWNPKSQSVNDPTKNIHTNYSSINVEILELRSEILIELNDVNRKNKSISSEWLKKVLEGPAEEAKLEGNVVYLYSYIESFIKKMESKSKLTPTGKVYSKGTISGYKQLLTKLEGFKNYKHIRITSIDKYFGEKFISLLIKQYLSANYIGKVVSRLKSVMNEARKDGYVKNLDYMMFAVYKEPVMNVYLSLKELNNIIKLDLSENKLLERARDVFVFGCFIGQRVSDYNTGEKYNVIEKEIKKGDVRIKKKVLVIYQKKTGSPVQIPLRSEAVKILEKYNYQLPKLVEQRFNLNLKTIGELAEIYEDVEIKITRGGQVYKETLPKYDLIKTHTARRSMITNMVIEGSLNMRQMMSISGHKSERDFNNYVKAGYKDYLPDILSSNFFND